LDVEKKNRPKWVWAITIIFFFAPGWTLLSFYLVSVGSIPIAGPVKVYFESLTTFDHILTVAIVLANFLGAIALFLLKKIAFYLFTGALIGNFLVTIWYALSKGWLVAFGGRVVFATLIGWALLVAVCIYLWNLKKKGVLR